MKFVTQDVTTINVEVNMRIIEKLIAFDKRLSLIVPKLETWVDIKLSYRCDWEGVCSLEISGLNSYIHVELEDLGQNTFRATDTRGVSYEFFTVDVVEEEVRLMLVLNDYMGDKVGSLRIK